MPIWGLISCQSFQLRPTFQPWPPQIHNSLTAHDSTDPFYKIRHPVYQFLDNFHFVTMWLTSICSGPKRPGAIYTCSIFRPKFETDQEWPKLEAISHRYNNRYKCTYIMYWWENIIRNFSNSKFKNRSLSKRHDPDINCIYFRTTVSITASRNIWGYIRRFFDCCSNNRKSIFIF